MTFSVYYTNLGYVSQDTYLTLQQAKDAARKSTFDCAIIRDYGYDRVRLCPTGTTVGYYSYFGGYREVR